MEKELDEILAFVSGKISPHEFRDQLYASETFDTLLANDPKLPRDGYVKGNVYRFLLQLDFDDAGDVFDAQGALMQFMDRNGISYTKTDKYEVLCDLIRKTQPGWGMLPVKFVQEHLLPYAGNRKAKELVTWLKAKIRKRFRYLKSPPRWIQNAVWPINEDGPLVFLGQMDVNDYFHDHAAVYVFHDPKNGTCETIIQVY